MRVQTRDERNKQITMVIIRIRIGYLIAREQRRVKVLGNAHNIKRQGNAKNLKQIAKPIGIRKRNGKAGRDDPSEINQSENKHASKETLEPKQPHIPGDRIICILLLLFQ